MVPPLPPGMEVVGWMVWILLVVLLGVGVIYILRSVLPNVLYPIAPQGRSDTFDETMRELLREIKMLRKEIEDLRRELKE